jgi:hypothetical protein
MMANPDNSNQIIIAGDGVNLRDLGNVDQLLRRFRNPPAINGAKQDCGYHARPSTL